GFAQSRALRPSSSKAGDTARRPGADHGKSAGASEEPRIIERRGDSADAHARAREHAGAAVSNPAEITINAGRCYRTLIIGRVLLIVIDLTLHFLLSSQTLLM